MATTTATKREQITQLMQEMQQGQVDALTQFGELLNSDGAKQLEAEITALQQLAIPGSNFDTQLINLQTVLSNLRTFQTQALQQAQTLAQVQSA